MELLKGVTAVRVCRPILDQYYFLTLIHPRSFLTQNHSQSAAPHLCKCKVSNVIFAVLFFFEKLMYISSIMLLILIIIINNILNQYLIK